MNRGATSKEDILQACRKIVARGSLKAVNMRTVAAECQIALGTLYNYYSNKDEYPDFFAAHSASIATSQRGKAKSIMEHYFVHMKKEMEAVLESDSNVNQACFSVAFTRSDFLDFIINHIILCSSQIQYR